MYSTPDNNIDNCQVNTTYVDNEYNEDIEVNEYNKDNNLTKCDRLNLLIHKLFCCTMIDILFLVISTLYVLIIYQLNIFYKRAQLHDDKKAQYLLIVNIAGWSLFMLHFLVGYIMVKLNKLDINFNTKNENKNENNGELIVGAFIGLQYLGILIFICVYINDYTCGETNNKELCANIKFMTGILIFITTASTFPIMMIAIYCVIAIINFILCEIPVNIYFRHITHIKNKVKLINLKQNDGMA